MSSNGVPLSSRITVPPFVDVVSNELITIGSPSRSESFAKTLIITMVSSGVMELSFTAFGCVLNLVSCRSSVSSRCNTNIPSTEMS